MMHGPNNQINAIKETLALAKVLGGTCVLPDLQSHMFTDKSEDPMRFTDLFDVGHIKANTDSILLEDLPGRLGNSSWNGQLDAVLLLVPPDLTRFTGKLIESMGLKAPSKERWITSPVTSWDGCAQSRVDELRTLLAPHRIVAVQTFHGLIFASHVLAGPLSVTCGDACCQAFKDWAPALRKSQVLYDMADRFIKERLGTKPYIAAHVRPYPDPCLRVWTEEDTPERTERMQKYCNNEYLPQRLAPSLKHLLDKYGLSTVFVMTHPKVRAVVQGLLRKAGIEPVFMELQDMKPPQGGLATNVSFSLLAMVEEAVCTRAKAFVGTKESSMTGTIVQERIGHRLPSDDSYCFSRRKGYEQRPMSVSSWYNETRFSLRGTDKWRKRLADKGLKRP